MAAGNGIAVVRTTPLFARRKPVYLGIVGALAVTVSLLAPGVDARLVKFDVTTKESPTFGGYSKRVTAMGKLMALVEAYPELKADQNLRELAEELTSTENKVAFSRQLFNDATLDYNNAAQQFPTSMMANLFGFREAAMLQSTASEAERATVRVQL